MSVNLWQRLFNVRFTVSSGPSPQDVSSGRLLRRQVLRRRFTVSSGPSPQDRLLRTVSSGTSPQETGPEKTVHCLLRTVSSGRLLRTSPQETGPGLYLLGLNYFRSLLQFHKVKCRIATELGTRTIIYEWLEFPITLSQYENDDQLFP